MTAVFRESPELYFGSTDEFVREYLRNVYRRTINGRSRVWAAAWWQYDEAGIRLETLWRAWEHLRLDPATGMSVWWRDHADHHMPALMDPNGAFAALARNDPINRNDPRNRNDKGAPLPYVEPPAGLFPDVCTALGPTDPGVVTTGGLGAAHSSKWKIFTSDSGWGPDPTSSFAAGTQVEE